MLLCTKSFYMRDVTSIRSREERERENEFERESHAVFKTT